MPELPQGRSARGAVEIAQEAAREAGEILLAHFSGNRRGRLKGQGNLVTEADLLCEKAILARLQEEFPGFGILSEESPPVHTPSPYTWIVDPLDGSNNFSFGLPFFSVNIALARGEEILLGVTYDPLRRELFWAEKGRGAYMNGKAISVSSRKRIKDSVVALDLGYEQEKGQKLLEIARQLKPRVFSLRILGSGALGLAYVACGRADLYLHLSLYPWDMASGRLLIEEAGGLVTDWQGQPLTMKSEEIVAGNKAVHREFMGLLERGFQG